MNVGFPGRGPGIRDYAEHLGMYAAEYAYNEARAYAGREFKRHAGNFKQAVSDYLTPSKPGTMRRSPFTPSSSRTATNRRKSTVRPTTNRVRTRGTATPARNIAASSGYRASKVSYTRKKHRSKAKVKAWKRFSTKVNKVIDKAQPYGYFNQVDIKRLDQDTINKWKVIKHDKDLTFFQPGQFKDAEACCFNEKPITATGWYDNSSVKPNGNFDTNNITHVIDSNVKFKFVNTSQHVTFVEMYICKAKKAATTNVTIAPGPLSEGKDPVELWGDTLNTTSIRGNLLSDVTQALTSSHYQSKQLNAMYDVKLVKFKFEPGQVQTHFMQGPKNYRMDGSKKQAAGATNINDPVWQNYLNPGSGVFVFFRVLNEVTLGGSGLPAHFPHNQAVGLKGGIALEYYKYYKMRGPNSNSTQSDDFISNTIVGQDYVDDAVTGDIQIDPDNPASFPATPQ